MKPRKKKNNRGNGESLSTSEEVDVLRKERDDYREQVLRARAEFANDQKDGSNKPTPTGLTP